MKKVDYPPITIIIPTLNEEKNLLACLSSIKKINYPQKSREIIIADGGSVDQTVKIAKKFGAKVVFNPKKTVATGRNVGFKAAKFNLVAFTDADCTFHPDWLKNSLKYFKNKDVACVGGPNLTPTASTSIAQALGFVMNQEIFSAGSIHARILKQTLAVRSLPGCNSIYTREAIKKVMPQNETLLTCDETEMNYRLVDLGYKLLYTPDVVVYHQRRNSFKGIFIQFYRYAIGRMQLKKLRKDGASGIHLLVGLTFPVFLILILWQPWRLFLVLIIFYFICLFWATYQLRFLKIAFLVPLIILTIAFSWSFGFIKELILPTKIE